MQGADTTCHPLHTRLQHCTPSCHHLFPTFWRAQQLKRPGLIPFTSFFPGFPPLLCPCLAACCLPCLYHALPMPVCVFSYPFMPIPIPVFIFICIAFYSFLLVSGSREVEDGGWVGGGCSLQTLRFVLHTHTAFCSILIPQITLPPPHSQIPTILPFLLCILTMPTRWLSSSKHY